MNRIEQILAGVSGLHPEVEEAYRRLWRGEPALIPTSTDCTHRLAQLKGPAGWTVCPSCEKNVRIKVFGCTLHERCTIEPTDPAVKDCRNCQDRLE